MAYQYLEPKIPDRWNGDEQRFAQGILDVLTSVHSWRGNLGLNDLSEKAREQLAVKAAEALNVEKRLRDNNRKMLNALHEQGVIDDKQLEILKLTMGV